MDHRPGSANRYNKRVERNYHPVLGATYFASAASQRTPGIATRQPELEAAL